MAQPAEADLADNLAGDFEPATEQQWLDMVGKVLGGRPVASLCSRTSDGLEVQPLYTDGPDEFSTGAPGAAPFTRGFTATQRDGGRWDLRTTIDDTGRPEGAYAAAVELERGATSLLVGGGALAGEASLGSALTGVQLDLVPVVLAPSSGFATSAEWLMTLWADAGLADDSVGGGFGADPIGVLACDGRIPQGIDRALADATGLAVMAANRYPRVRTWSVDATPYAEAGAGEALELAAMLSTAVAYLRSMQDAGMDADDAAARIEITLGVDADFFTTIAKLRAARRTYGAMSQACGVDPAVAPPALVVRTLRRDLSRRDPWVNMLRVTSGAFAGALGGADTVITAPFDSELGRPSELGRRMARNTQLLLSEESNVGRVIDPAGGSWYIETLTESIATEAWSMFRMFEGAGGMTRVLTDGTLAARIRSVRDRRASAVATRRAPITGVSEFPNLDERLPEVEPASSGNPVQAPETDAVTTCERLEPTRWAEPFEALRDAADAARITAGTGAAAEPRVFLANLGSVATHTARASWARNFFEAGGIAAASSQRGTSTGFGSAAEAAEDFAADPARIACICSSDETYADLAVETVRALAGAGAERIYLAGRPAEVQAELEDAGVDQFVHAGVDLLEVLGRAHELLGIAPSGGGLSSDERPEDHR